MDILSDRWGEILGKLAGTGTASGQALGADARAVSAALAPGGRDTKALPQNVQEAVLVCLSRASSGEVDGVRTLDLLDAAAQWGGLRPELEKAIVQRRSKQIAETITLSPHSSGRMLQAAAKLCTWRGHRALLDHPNTPAKVRLSLVAAAEHNVGSRAVRRLTPDDADMILDAYEEHPSLTQHAAALARNAYHPQRIDEWLRLVVDAAGKQLEAGDLVPVNADVRLHQALEEDPKSSAGAAAYQAWWEAASEEEKSSVVTLAAHVATVPESELGRLLRSYDPSLVEATCLRGDQGPRSIARHALEDGKHLDVHQVLQLSRCFDGAEREELLLSLAETSPEHAEVCVEALAYTPLSEVPLEIARKVLEAAGTPAGRLRERTYIRLNTVHGEAAWGLVTPAWRMTSLVPDEEDVARWVRERLDPEEFSVFWSLLPGWTNSAEALVEAAKVLSRTGEAVNGPGSRTRTAREAGAERGTLRA